VKADEGGGELIYEVEYTLLDPEVVAAFDAWLPEHVRAVTACEGFTGAEIQVPGTDADGPPIRRTQYRLESRAALERYLTEDAPRMRADGAARFGDMVAYARRVLGTAEVGPRLPEMPLTCQNCGSVVTGKYCAACGQAGHVHVMTIADVTHDVVHSALHLDSRVWRTLRSLVLRPGELTNEFITGRRERYLPPFRLYLVISIAFFAISSLLPDSGFLRVTEGGETVVAPIVVLGEQAEKAADRAGQGKARAAEELEKIATDPDLPSGLRGMAAEAAREVSGEPSTGAVDEADAERCSVNTGWQWFDGLMTEACRKVEEDRGKRLGAVFMQTAPKLMFVFLPLMAAVAMLFYWRPRRLYAEHLVAFLHVHAFMFLYLAASSLVGSLNRTGLPGTGLLGVVSAALTAYLAWYVYRAMRVVYGNGRLLTGLKYAAIGSIYFTLLGLTMAVGIVYSMLSL
jgi:hypothetical protein